MHGDHGIEIVLGHVPDHALAQHASRIDDEIDLAERVRALANHAAGTGVVSDRVIVGERIAAGLGDFRHHLVGRALGRDLAVAAGAGVVDDDAGALPGHEQRDAATDAAPGSSDDAGLIFEIHRSFSCLLWAFVIENHAGAGGLNGIASVAKSSPDGYTVGSEIERWGKVIAATGIKIK